MEHMNEHQKRKARKKRRLKIFWGLLFVLGAAGLIVTQLELVSGELLIPLFAIVILCAGVVNGIVNRNFGYILFSLALLAIVLGSVMGVPGLDKIAPWALLVTALLLTVGLGLLFPNFEKRPWRRTYVTNQNGAFGGDGFTKSMKKDVKINFEEIVDEETRNGDRVSYDNKFGSAVKYLVGEVSSVDIHSSFGAFELYFNDAVLTNNRAEVRVNASFGEVKLHIPRDWKAVFDVSSSMGGVDERGCCNPEGEKELHVIGNVSFGHLEIDYI